MSGPAEALPPWPRGTAALLSTVDGDGAPHTIPVSAAVRDGPRRIVLGLARTRGSLERLRADPRCAVTVLAEGDVAFTARGRAGVVREALEGAENVAAISVVVQEIRTHGDPRFEIDAGIAWHWTDAGAAARDAEVHAALAELAAADRDGG